MPGSSKIVHHFISYVFRVLLYALALVIIFHNNDVNTSNTLLIFVAHFGVFLLAKLKKWPFMETIRLVNDYVFIYFILNGKTLHNIANFSLFILPIINSPNYTGRYSLRASILLYTTAIITAALISPQDLTVLFVLPMFIFFLINSFSKWRESRSQLESKLSESVNKYIESTSYVSRHQTLADIKKAINKDLSGLFANRILAILCYRTDGTKLSFICSSEDKNHYEANYHKAVLVGKKLDTNEVLELKVTLNNKEVSVFTYSKIEIQAKMNTYLFVALFDNEGYSNTTQRILALVLKKFTRALDSEVEMSLRIKFLRTQIQDKEDFITDSVTNVHFVNNQLGPIKSHLYLLELIRKTKNPSLASQLKVQAANAENQANHSLRLIIDRNKRLLTKSNNPFNTTYETEVPFETLLQVIHILWGDANLENAVIQPTSSIIVNGLKVKVNLFAFQNLIDEILVNMKKHCADIKSCECEVSIDNSTCKIEFKNSVKDEDESKVIGLIKTLDSESESSDTESHGFTIIREGCEKIKSRLNLALDNKTLSLTVSLALKK